MLKVNSKVIDFGDYLKSHPSFDQKEVEAFITEQRLGLRRLEAEVFHLLLKKHKLKNVQLRKETSVAFESNLVQISDWLEDKIAQVKGDNSAEPYQLLFKQCEQLISRNERIKKNISDDMSACRYVEGRDALDPLKIGGFLIGPPLTLAGFFRTLYSNRPDLAWKAFEAGVVIGLFLSFHRQAKEFCIHSGRALLNSPSQLPILKKNFRNSAFNAAMKVSIVMAEANGLETNYPARTDFKPKIYIAAKL